MFVITLRTHADEQARYRPGLAAEFRAIGLRHVHPEVVEIALGTRGREAIAAEEPQISTGVGPAAGFKASDRNVAWSERALRAVGTVLVDNLGARNPCPLAAAIFP